MAPSTAVPRPASRVEVIDLYTAEPAELQRLLEQWRSTALAQEHLADAVIARDDSDRGHVVLQVEYVPDAGPAVVGTDGSSPEAGRVAALLDRPPRFRC